jgi:hypothetical protein
MNTWRSRFIVFAAFWLVMQIHGDVTHCLPNTPGGMLVFHGSAAAVDLFLLYCVPWLLEGRLCDDIQTLCLVSIVANLAGWLLYLAYASPVLYNTFMWGLAYVQWLRILVVDRNDADTLGFHLVRRPYLLGA